MRASAPLQVRLQPQGAWRAGVVVLAACAIGSMSAWALAPQPAAWRLLVAALLSLAVVCSARSLLRPQTGILRWDGACWSLDRIDSARPDPCRGELSVALDLGGWMLLRFVPEGAGVQWLPVQRAGLGSQWHALRCAVHSSRPALADPAALDR